MLTPCFLLLGLCLAFADKRFVLEGDIQYRVTVTTVDRINAGTNANVFLSITGDKGVTPEAKLSPTDRSSFSRGRVDQFVVKGPSVGKITSIHVRHDNQGALPSWELDKITIEDGTAIYEFPCQCWLDHVHSPRSFSRTISVGSSHPIKTK